MMKKITIDYTNYKGERKLYDILPQYLKYEQNNEFHGSGFILKATRCDICEMRSFALKDIHNPEVFDGVVFFPS